MLPRQNVIKAKCYQGNMLSRQNVTKAKCYQGKMLQGKLEQGKMLPRQNVTRQNVTRQNVTEPKDITAMKHNQFKEFKITFNIVHDIFA